MTLRMKIDEEREEARQEGIVIGIAQGLNKGIAQGAHDKAIETAKLMLANKMAVEDIIKYTGLSAEEISRISAEL